MSWSGDLRIAANWECIETQIKIDEPVDEFVLDLKIEQRFTLIHNKTCVHSFIGWSGSSFWLGSFSHSVKSGRISWSVLRKLSLLKDRYFKDKPGFRLDLMEALKLHCRCVIGRELFTWAPPRAGCRGQGPGQCCSSRCCWSASLLCWEWCQGASWDSTWRIPWWKRKIIC